jgi:uncharacterized membrane protein
MAIKAPVELVVALLGYPAERDRAERRLVELRKNGALGLLSVAMLAKDDDGEVSVQETPNLPETQNPLLDAMAGGALGLFAGTTGLLMGATAGAAAGYVPGHVTGQPNSKKHLNALAHELPPGTSALVALIEHESVESTVHNLNPLAWGLWRFVLDATDPRTSSSNN